MPTWFQLTDPTSGIWRLVTVCLLLFQYLFSFPFFSPCWLFSLPNQQRHKPASPQLEFLEIKKKTIWTINKIRRFQIDISPRHAQQASSVTDSHFPTEKSEGWKTRMRDGGIKNKNKLPKPKSCHMARLIRVANRKPLKKRVETFKKEKKGLF